VKNEKGWESNPVIQYCACIVPGRDKPKSFTGNIPWVTTEDLNHLSKTINSKKSIGLSSNEIEFVKAKIIPVNSVIMTCVGDLGVISINTQEIVINQQLHAFQCGEKINPTFLMYALSYQKDYMYKMSSSTTVPYMNKSVCNSIPIICPQLDLQKDFENKILQLQKTRELSSFHLGDSLFNSLLQKAFKGELVA
jgi:type I restriction enzyme S subunit